MFKYSAKVTTTAINLPAASLKNLGYTYVVIMGHHLLDCFGFIGLLIFDGNVRTCLKMNLSNVPFQKLFQCQIRPVSRKLKN